MELNKKQVLLLVLLVIVFLSALLILRRESAEIALIDEPSAAISYEVEQEP